MYSLDGLIRAVYPTVQAAIERVRDNQIDSPQLEALRHRCRTISTLARITNWGFSEGTQGSNSKATERVLSLELVQVLKLLDSTPSWPKIIYFVLLQLLGVDAFGSRQRSLGLHGYN